MRVDRNLPPAAAPTPIGLGPNQVGVLAEDVAKQIGYKAGDDLKDVVTRLGGKIAYVDFWGGSAPASGSIEISRNAGDKSTFEIRLALDTGVLRDRFTIAHELGHYVLHYLYPNKVNGQNIQRLIAQRYGSGQVEKEANWFAAAFLMPKEEYRRKFEEFAGDHLDLSDYFRVSAQASSVRAKVLGLE